VREVQAAGQDVQLDDPEVALATRQGVQLDDPEVALATGQDVQLDDPEMALATGQDVQLDDATRQLLKRGCQNRRLRGAICPWVDSLCTITAAL
jgi:hypothetical protein